FARDARLVSGRRLSCRLRRGRGDDLAGGVTLSVVIARRVSDEAIHSAASGWVDCFAEPVIGRAFARPVGSQGRSKRLTLFGWNILHPRTMRRDVLAAVFQMH